MERKKIIRYSAFMSGILVTNPLHALLRNSNKGFFNGNIPPIGKKYYIQNQSDFDRYKSERFEAGAIILFAKGEVFTGQFSPQGSGTLTNPIIVTAYDKASGKIYHNNTDGKPIINGMAITAGKTVEHQFPDGYSAHWVRTMVDKSAKVTVQFFYT